MAFKSDMKMILIIFIGLIIATVFIASIGDQIFLETNTFNQTNFTVTAPAINGTVLLTGRELVPGTTPIVRNATNFELQNAGIFVTDGLINGVKTVFLSVNDSGFPSNASSVNVSYNFNPDGYLSDSGTRSITLLILIFSALAALIFVIVQIWKNDSFQNLLGR